MMIGRQPNGFAIHKTLETNNNNNNKPAVTQHNTGQLKLIHICSHGSNSNETQQSDCVENY